MIVGIVGFVMSYHCSNIEVFSFFSYSYLKKELIINHFCIQLMHETTGSFARLAIFSLELGHLPQDICWILRSPPKKQGLQPPSVNNPRYSALY